MLVTFGLTLGSGFVYDDHFIVEQNPYLESPRDWSHLLTEQSWSGAEIQAYTYRPLPMLTFGLNYQLSGLQPFTYHLGNLAIHCLVVQLLFSMALKLRLSLAGSAFAASVFAVHPLQVEPVSAIVGRMDLMAGAFLLGALLLHLRGRSRVLEGESGRRALTGAVVLYGAALLSKENVILFPAITGVYDLLFFRSRARREYWVYGGYLAVSGGYLMIRKAVLGGAILADVIPFLDNPLAHVASPLRVVSSLKVAFLYLGHLLLPVDLSPDYCYAQILPFERLTEPLAVASVIGSALLLGLGFVLGRRNHLAAVAIALSLLTFLPISNLFFPIGTVMGNRLMYLPLIGISLLGGHFWDRTLKRNRAMGVAAAMVVVIALMSLSMTQSWHWRNNLSVDLLATKAAPNCSRGHSNLGYDSLMRGDFEQAERAFLRSLEIYPAFDAPLAGLATVAFRRGEYDAALDWVMKALDENPASTSALGLAADISMRMGDASRARYFWEKRLELEAHHSETLSNLAVLAWQRQEKQVAIELWTRASLQKDARAEVWLNLGRAHDALGDFDAAVAAYQAYVRSEEADPGLKVAADERIRQLRPKDGD